ncbi:MAG: alkene reductase [Rhodospirillum sp.]|nr:alkene reductase [Rhodospirillum sp.]MCF8487915.1 alkene reductase [Rhodospirillum sp.]MCF8501835.1 alkene reductase [Rhodospirillum sp.]
MSADILFTPQAMGPLTLSNRIVMAPLTRARAGAGDVPTDLMATYYGQRATAGLIISEATPISNQGKGYAFTPGCYNAAQAAGWRKITDAVHAKGGKIFAQLWHVGRISHPDLQENGLLPVAPSAIKADGQAFTAEGFKPFVTPRALETSEIPGIVADYVNAAQTAMDGGFDGVEIHAANGYLLDQFMRAETNQRTDAYGGSPENRLRLTLEVAQAVTNALGGDRVGIRISPVSPANGPISDPDPQSLFTALATGLNALDLVYLHVVEGATGGDRDIQAFDYGALKSTFKGLYMANNGYTRESAIAALSENKADLVALGRPFIANPDLVARFKTSAPLNPLDRDTLYGGAEKGYIDYPALESA